MIIYFTATNNCKFIAEEIANNTSDIAISMTDIKKEIILAENEQLGIITPTYFW